MPEPTAAVAAGVTVAATAGALQALPVVASVTPQLIVFGISLGLRADVLLAGFAGSLAAMAFLNAVPSSGDTWRDLFKTTLRRLGFSLASCLSAGYLTPLALLVNGFPETLMLSMAFVVGAAAQEGLARWLKARGVPVIAKEAPDAQA